MKKLLLLIPLLFLCSCGINKTSSQLTTSEQQRSVDYKPVAYDLDIECDDGFRYIAYVNYQYGYLELCKREVTNEDKVKLFYLVKTWDIGKYSFVIDNTLQNDTLYDYGDYAIYRSIGK